MGIQWDFYAAIQKISEGVMNTILSQMQIETRCLSLAEGGNDTGIPFVTAWRFTSGRIQMPNTDNPYLYLVLDGMLRLYTPSA